MDTAAGFEFIISDADSPWWLETGAFYIVNGLQYHTTTYLPWRIRDFTVIGAILDRGQKSERKQYGADLMKAQFEECKMWNIDSISSQIFILTANGLTDTYLFTM